MNAEATPALLIATLLAEALATLGVSVGVFWPARRLWPPARPESRSGGWMTFVFCVAGVGVIVLGVAGWGSLGLPRWSRWLIGLPVWAAGNGLASWAVVVLGIRPTVGGAGPLVRRGPYRFLRHPQYVGFVAGLMGWILLSASRAVVAPALAAVAPLLLAARAEERWLAERHGPADEAERRAGQVLEHGEKDW